MWACSFQDVNSVMHSHNNDAYDTSFLSLPWWPSTEEEIGLLSADVQTAVLFGRDLNPLYNFFKVFTFLCKPEESPKFEEKSPLCRVFFFKSLLPLVSLSPSLAFCNNPHPVLLWGNCTHIHR